MSRAIIPDKPKIERAKGKDRWPLNTQNAIVIEGWKDDKLKSRLLELSLQGYSPEEVMGDDAVLEQLTNGVLDRASGGEKSFTDGTVKLALTIMIKRLIVRGRGLGAAVYTKLKNQTRSRAQVERRTGTKPEPKPLTDWVMTRGGRPIKPRKAGNNKGRKVETDAVDEAIMDAIVDQSVPIETADAGSTPEVIDRTEEMGDVIDRVIKETAFTPRDFESGEEILEYLQGQGVTISQEELSQRMQRLLGA